VEPAHLPGTVAVREAHRFDVAALERYMADHIDGFAGPLAVWQFVGGQSNPTYYMTAGDQAYVLRRKPPGKLLPSAHLIEREYRIISALAGSGVPVPRAHVLCEDPSVIGTAFYVMEFVPGRVFTAPPLPGLAPAERRVIY